MEKEFPSPTPLASYNLTEIRAAHGYRGWPIFDDWDLKDKLVLDLGAWIGRLGYACWRRGAQVVLLDIFSTAFPSFLIGVVADKANMPFPSGTFDYVVTSNTLHHGDLEPTVAEVRRILKMGGEFLSMQEPCVASSDGEQAILERDCQKQLEAGIDEHRPNYNKYHDAFAAHFSEFKILSGVDLSPACDQSYGGDGVVIWAKR